MPEEKRLLGTTRIQILKYLGTESSPWSGLLRLHLIVTTVARPFSQEVVTVEDLKSNTRRNAICFHYSKYTLLFHWPLVYSCNCHTEEMSFTTVLLPLSDRRKKRSNRSSGGFTTSFKSQTGLKCYSGNCSVFLASLNSAEPRNNPTHKTQ